MSGEDQRAARRSKLLLMVAMRLPARHSLTRVRVRDISAGGARLAYDGEVSPEEAVNLDLGAVGRVSGHIAWSANGEIGVAFDRPVDPERVRLPVTGSYQAPEPVAVARLRHV